MCGIAGIVAGSITMYLRNALQCMTDALAPRGPDGQGHHLFGSCALGHRRLAIVDLAGGKQPMCTVDGRMAITFNGEIYGYQALRRRISHFPFRTQSDTEVILALYQLHGAEAITKLPGMFAFALWDDYKRELFCGRDRFGEKPFYYARGRGGEFIFASEVKGILASGLIEPILDRKTVAHYLRRQNVGPDQSIYSNIRVLPPGHCLRYRDGKIEISRYWSLPEANSEIDMGEAVEQFRTLLRNAVRRQLVADVPVGAFLSGGLDSSTICLVASKLASDLRTFSFDFEGDHSEIAYARYAAAAYDTRHIELTARGVGIADELVRMQKVYDEPFADSSNIPTYLLAREARRHVKVVLTGDGGDELFGGYAWYKPLLWMLNDGRVGLLRWVAARAANRLGRLIHIPGEAAREARILGKAYGRQYNSILAAHKEQLSFFSKAELERLGILDGLAGGAQLRDAFGSMDDAIRFDVEDYMPADILTKIDRASMAHGLELRAPFLDVEFASFCLSLPYCLKVSTSEDKIILRRAFAERWPEAIRVRRKQGFGAPLSRWFQDPAVLELESNVLRDPVAPIYGIISFRETQNILRLNSLMQRWTLLVLAVWFAQRKNDCWGALRLRRAAHEADAVVLPTM